MPPPPSLVEADVASVPSAQGCFLFLSLIFAAHFITVTVYEFLNIARTETERISQCDGQKREEEVCEQGGNS